MTDNDTRPYEYEFTVTREAVTTITAMRDHCAKLGAYWGVTSTEYREAVASFANNIGTLFGNPIVEKTRVTRDGDLSLYVAGWLTFGLIWHGKRRHCTDPACGAYIEDDGSTWTYSTERSPVLDHEHALSYPLDAPQPGEWTLHS